MAEILPKGTRVMTMQQAGFGNLVGTVHGNSPQRVYVEFPDARLKVCSFTPKVLAELPLPMTRERWDSMTEQEQREYVERRRLRIRSSTDMNEDETAGWGELDEYGYFAYPCWWAIKDREAPVSDA